MNAFLKMHLLSPDCADKRVPSHISHFHISPFLSFPHWLSNAVPGEWWCVQTQFWLQEEINPTLDPADFSNSIHSSGAAPWI